MTSNGPFTSPPRAVVAHRAREGDTDREPNQHQYQHAQDHQQVEGTVRGGGSDERRQSWGGRDERNDRQSQSGRDGRDRGRDGRGRDSRNDRDSQRKARRSAGGGGGNSNQQNRNRSSRERSRSRGRHDRPSSAAGGEAAETRPSTGPIKRPRSPSLSFGTGPGSGGASTQSQNKRSRLDAQDTRGGRPRSRTSPPYHAQQHSSSRRYSSRSPPPPPSSSSRRDRRSKNKNKTRYPAVAGATGGEGEPRRLSSTYESTLPLNQHDGSGSPGRPGSSGEGDTVPYKGGNSADQELLPSDSRAPDDHAPHRPLSAAGRSASPHGRDTGRDKDRDRERRDRDRGRDKDRARGRDRDRERGRDRSKGHEKERGRDYDREHERDRNRDRDRDRNRGRDNRGRSPHSRKKKDHRRDYSRTSHSADTAANADQSADADMGARGRYRGSRGYSPCTSKGPYASQQQKQQQQKRRQHPNSQSDHATPNTSFNGSPPSQHSPYGEPQGWPAGHQQYSPQTHDTLQQYPHNYPPNDTPQGPSAYHYTGNSPPLDAPTGPGGQYAPYAGAGPAHGNDRGHQYAQGPDHSNHRNGQWDVGPGPGPEDVYPLPSLPSQQEGYERGHSHHHGHGGQNAPYYESDGTYIQDPNGASFSQAQNPYHQYLAGPEQPHSHPDDSSMGRHGWDHDIDMSRDRRDDQMPPPSRPLPPGSQSKFSFAFKATSKPPVTAPKAEIAQKLSNAVPRQPQQHQQPVQEDSLPPPSTPSHPGTLQLRPLSSESRKSFPRNAPTEPASSRTRSELRQRGAPSGPSGSNGLNGPPSGAPSGPSAASGPRYRKVKQIVRRPKPRLTLPEEMAVSESVYYRKPGNESIIGSGTYGQVFKAVHVYTRQLAALKKIRMDGEREGLPVTAIREIKLLQSLNHVNIVELLEVMVEEGHCYMVFEYLAHDLNGLLNHPTFKLDAAQKKHMGLQMFQGLDYLHRRGVLHRDIKAANILVSSDGTLKIADFGLARFFAKRHQLDYTNRVITIWYRPPELLLGETQYGAAVDIWSAACVLVEIFTRYPIFPGDGGEISQINKIYGLLGTPSKSDWPGLVDMPWFELLRPSHRLPNKLIDTYAHKVSPAALGLLIGMLQYDPAKRPSAAQVLEHPYFTQEEPAPRQAIELASIGGDWHEFDSKALRKENERKAKEAKEKEAKAKVDNTNAESNERKKRPPPMAADGADKVADETTQPEAKRQHVERADESKPQPQP